MITLKIAKQVGNAMLDIQSILSGVHGSVFQLAFCHFSSIAFTGTIKRRP